MSSLSSTQRTLRFLRQQGRICGIVERFNPYAGITLPNGKKSGIRQDLFGFIDIVVIDPDGICGVQSCGSNFASHKQKILENEIAPEWLKAGGKIELWGWRKVKAKRGGKQMVWRPRVYEFTLEDFNREED